MTVHAYDSARPVIRLRGVGRDFPGPPRVRVLSTLNLDIYPGEFVAIIGPSGSGKSTLLNQLGLLDRPTNGEYFLDMVPTSNLGERDRTALRGRRIGFVFQDFHLIPYRSAVDNVALGQLYTNPHRGSRRQAAIDALHAVGLDHRAHATPTTMSGGERQRVAIARAIAGRPAVLLCDEPTGNLDSATAGQVLDVLDQLHKDDATIVLVTHDPATAARANRTITLVDGRIAGEPSTGGRGET